MSLIRLLTTTRSLSDVKNEPSPYRMSQPGLLPKFGPRKQPKIVQQDSLPSSQSGGAKENLGEGLRDRTDAGCSLKSKSSRQPWWRRWFRRQPRREPVQAELALDLIRVVRNDLREAEENRNRDQIGSARKEQRPTEESVFGAPRG